MERGRIIVNNTDYTGSFVTPNPSEPPTKDLNTLEIEGEVFNIAGSGGGNGNFKTKVLLNQSATSGTYSLADDYTNYDLLAFWTTGQGYESSEAGVIVMTVDDLKKAQADNRVLTMFGYYNRYYNFNITPSQFTVQSQNDMTVVKIVGYKIYADCYNPIIYSTEEREVGVWTDNKPLYEKTVYYNTAIDYHSWVTIVNDSNITILDHEGTIYLDGSPYCDLDYHRGADGNEYVCSSTVNNGTQLAIYQSFNGYTVTCRVTYRYTKIADVAGSGEYNTLGIPNVHYDDNEKVVGTYFGETLYEKTLKSNSGIAQNSWVSIINDSSIRIKKYYGYIYYSANLEDGVKYPLDWTRVANSAFSCTECNGGSLEVVQNVGTSYGYDVTIQYTKTSN